MKRYGFHLAFVSLLLLSLFIFFSDLSGSPLLDRIKEVSYRAVLPVINLKEAIFNYVEENMSKYVLLVNLKEENSRLLKELEMCKVNEVELSTYRRVLRRLGQELKLDGFKSLGGVVFSRVVYYDPTGLDAFVIISAGRQSGVSRGDIVLSRGEVIGTVKEAYTATSKVITTLNGELNLSVLLESSGKAYIYRGGYPLGELLYVNKKDSISVGDKILYRDPEGRLPNFIVGYVDRIEKGESPFFRKVFVKPAADPRRSEMVIVLAERKAR